MSSKIISISGFSSDLTKSIASSPLEQENETKSLFIFKRLVINLILVLESSTIKTLYVLSLLVIFYPKYFFLLLEKFNLYTLFKI